KSRSVRSLVSTAPQSWPAKQSQTPSSVRATELPHRLPLLRFPSEPQNSAFDLTLQTERSLAATEVTAYQELECRSCTEVTDKAGSPAMQKPWYDHANAQADCS